MRAEIEAAEVAPRQQGFAALDSVPRHATARQGGYAAPAGSRAHTLTVEEDPASGKDGQTIRHDHTHMVAIGRRGGSQVSQDRTHMGVIGQLGGATGASPAAAPPEPLSPRQKIYRGGTASGKGRAGSGSPRGGARAGSPR